MTRKTKSPRLPALLMPYLRTPQDIYWRDLAAKHFASMAPGAGMILTGRMPVPVFGSLLVH